MFFLSKFIIRVSLAYLLNFAYPLEGLLRNEVSRWWWDGETKVLSHEGLGGREATFLLNMCLEKQIKIWDAFYKEYLRSADALGLLDGREFGECDLFQGGILQDLQYCQKILRLCSGCVQTSPPIEWSFVGDGEDHAQWSRQLFPLAEPAFPTQVHSKRAPFRALITGG